MPTLSYSLGTAYDFNNNIDVDLSGIITAGAGEYSVWARTFRLDCEYYDSQTDVYKEGHLNFSEVYTIYVDFSDVTNYISIDGTDGDDVLIVGSGGSFVNSENGNDYLKGGAGVDFLTGGHGDDLIIGGLGGDFLAGDEGPDVPEYKDTLSYETSTGGVSVSLDGSTVSGGDAEGDDISGFENLRGSTSDDNLYGDDSDNVIDGWGGADALYGRGGDDRLVMTGAGSVDGGDDYDILVLAAGAGDYDFPGGDVQNIERVNLRDGVTADFSEVSSPGLFVSFSEAGGGVSLAATDQSETIRLGEGADTVFAAGGDDRVYAYAGGASIHGGSGTDRLFVQAGEHAFSNETLTGVESIVVRSGASIDLSAMAAFSGPIASTSAAGGGAVIVGSSGSDRIRLGAGGDDVTGGAGSDRLSGGDGEDVFHFTAPGFGRDQVFAELGADHIDLAGVATSLDDLSFRTAKNGLDVVVAIEGLPRSDAIFIKGVTVAEVEAADGFFLF